MFRLSNNFRPLPINTSSLNKGPSEKYLRFFGGVKKCKMSQYLRYLLYKNFLFSRFNYKLTRYTINTILHMHITKSNMFITVTTLMGHLLFKVTPKIVRQYLRWQKTRHFTVTKMAYKITNQLYRLYYRNPLTLRIYFYKGMPIWWTVFLRAQLIENVFSIVSKYVFLVVVKDIFYVCHNGCRRPKRLHKKRGRVKRGWKRSTKAKKAYSRKYYLSFFKGYNYKSLVWK